MRSFKEGTKGFQALDPRWQLQARSGSRTVRGKLSAGLCSPWLGSPLYWAAAALPAKGASVDKADIFT